MNTRSQVSLSPATMFNAFPIVQNYSVAERRTIKETLGYGGIIFPYFQWNVAGRRKSDPLRGTVHYSP